MKGFAIVVAALAGSLLSAAPVAAQVRHAPATHSGTTHHHHTPHTSSGTLLGANTFSLNTTFAHNAALSRGTLSYGSHYAAPSSFGFNVGNRGHLTQNSSATQVPLYNGIVSVGSVVPLGGTPMSVTGPSGAAGRAYITPYNGVTSVGGR